MALDTVAEKGSDSRKISVQRAFGIWNIIIVLVATGASFTIPLHMLIGSPSREFFLVREMVLTLVFGLDIYFSWLRIKSRHSAQLFEHSILRYFYKRWLIADIIAAIPFALFLDNPFFEFLHLLKLIKVFFLAFILARIYIRFKNTVLLLQIIYWTFLLAHWLSCGWLYMRGVVDTPTYSDYIGALYWTVATMTTVGYGDITPQTDAERLYAVFTMVLGYSLIGYLIGSIAGILSKKNPAREKYLQNLEQLADAVRYAHIPLELQQRIHSYFMYKLERGFGYDVSSLINELPPGLGAEVSLCYRQEVIERIYLFQDAPHELIMQVAQHLIERIVPEGDLIFKSGDPGQEVFFIARGEVGVYNATNQSLIRHLKEGDYFGEISLFENIPRTATVRAESYCDLYLLHKNKFDQIFEKFPDVKAKVMEKAEMRQKS